MSRPTSLDAARFFDRMAERGLPLPRATAPGDYDVVDLRPYASAPSKERGAYGARGIEGLLHRGTYGLVQIFLQVGATGWYLGPPPSHPPMLGPHASPAGLADDLADALELLFAKNLAETLE